MGNGEPLRLRERCQGRWEVTGVQKPSHSGAEQSRSVMGSNVTNRLRRPLFKHAIATDEREYT